MEVIFGSEFDSNDGPQSLNNLGKTINLVYFAALWCPPSVDFKEKLQEFYEKANLNNKCVEVIFVSLDYSNSDFKNFSKQMPWLSIPYKKQQRRKRILDYYKIINIPTLVLIDSKGNLLSSTCVNDICKLGQNWKNFWTNLYKL